MSEQLKSHEDNKQNHEQLVSKEQQQQNQERTAERARKALEKHAETDKYALKQEVEKQAKESKDYNLDKRASETRDDTALPGVQQSMKNHTYKRELSKIQTKLPKTSRRFSKVVHSKTVEAISNVGANTVARPSGLLGGSVFAFLGSLVTYYMARHYGFRYNYLMMFLLFIGGFAIGAVIELLVWTFSRRRSHY